MDLSKLSTEKKNDEGVPMTLTHPGTGEKLRDDQKKEMVIWLVGQDSKEYTSRQAAAYSKNRGKNKAPTWSQLKTSSTDLLVACTKGFDNLQLKGEHIEFNYKNATKFYNDYAWAKDQVEAFIHDRANFLGN